MVVRVTKTANFKEDKRMVPVVEGELLVELGPIPNTCPGCNAPVAMDDCSFCPKCGTPMNGACPA